MLSKYRGVILGLAYADALGAGYEFFKGRIGEDEVIDFLEIPKITAHKKLENGKWVKVEQWLSREAAEQAIIEAVAAYTA